MTVAMAAAMEQPPHTWRRSQRCTWRRLAVCVFIPGATPGENPTLLPALGLSLCIRVVVQVGPENSSWALPRPAHPRHRSLGAPLRQPLPQRDLPSGMPVKSQGTCLGGHSGRGNGVLAELLSAACCVDLGPFCYLSSPTLRLVLGFQSPDLGMDIEVVLLAQGGHNVPP